MGLLSGCSLPIVKGGRLHAVPSTAADLPFRSDGIYVNDGTTHSCHRQDEGLDDLTTDSTWARAVAFTPTGEFLIARSARAIRTDSFWVGRGTYRVEETFVDARTYTGGGDTLYKGYVDRYPIVPTGPDTFYMERVIDHPPRWIRYNTYTPRTRSCVRQPFAFEGPDLSSRLGPEAGKVGANSARRDG